MYFPVSGVEVPVWLPPLVAFLISAFTSTGGVSGAFLILPFQVSILGFTTPAVSATNNIYNVVAIPSGVIQYIKEGRMVWPLTWIVILGTLPGVFLGALIRINYLPNPSNFKIFAGFVLLYLGFRIVKDIIFKNKHNAAVAEDKFKELVLQNKQIEKETGKKIPLPKAIVKKFNLNHLVYEFHGDRFDVPTIKIFLISCIVGIVGGAYGIGGGAIMAPIYVAFFRLPVYTVAGAALMGTFITSIAAVIFFQILAPFYPNIPIAPDWMLGALFGIGGILGMYIGAKLQKYMPAKLIKWILGICILFIAIKYITGF